jgi:uncharacterized protein (TIGR02646 family)
MDFYPDLLRRDTYPTKTNGNFYSYSSYRDNIHEDCQNRCVYCDITIDEHGGEGFHLDHFKPQSTNSELINDPNNLVSSCPKCNYFKSDHWPDSYPNVSFLDPFEVGRVNRLVFNVDGSISPAVDNQAIYQIELLNLNRPARIQLRRFRLQSKQICELVNYLDREFQEIVSQMELDSSEIKLLPRAKLCSSLMSELNELLS